MSISIKESRKCLNYLLRRNLAKCLKNVNISHFTMINIYIFFLWEYIFLNILLFNKINSSCLEEEISFQDPIKIKLNWINLGSFEGRETKNPHTFACLVFDTAVLLITKNWENCSVAVSFWYHFEDPSFFASWSLLPSLKELNGWI